MHLTVLFSPINPTVSVFHLHSLSLYHSFHLYFPSLPVRGKVRAFIRYVRFHWSLEKSGNTETPSVFLSSPIGPEYTEFCVVGKSVASSAHVHTRPVLFSPVVWLAIYCENMCVQVYMRVYGSSVTLFACCVCCL